MHARALPGGVKVEFYDVAVTLAPDKKSAVATLTGKARMAGEKEFFLQVLKFSLNRMEGEWLVSRVETVKAL